MRKPRTQGTGTRDRTVDLSAIVMDTSIQCRARIDTERVDEYALAMAEGSHFPPVDLFGTEAKCWIGDGWHRVLAVQQVGTKKVRAVLHPGGRAEALKHALGANAAHGLRRTNADKRRAVEVALREFPKLSSRAVAELCGVSHMTVQRVQDEQVEHCSTSQPSRQAARLTGLDGKQYPAARRESCRESPAPDAPPNPEVEQEEEWAVPRRKPTGPPCWGLQMARIAIMKLEEIRRDDTERAEAFALVRRWLDEHED